MRRWGTWWAVVALSGCAGDASGPWTVVEAGRHAACAIDAATELHCWGDLDYGATATTARGVVHADGGPPAGPGWVDVALGAAHGCALDDQGEVTCWGDDVAGEATPYVGPFVRLEAGLEITCGVFATNEVQCWGQQPDADLSGRMEDLDVTQDRGCALSEQGEARCWGGLTPITGPYSDVGAGCGVLEDGDVECFHEGLLSQSGPYTAVAVGADEACATDANGGLWCWRDLVAGSDPVGEPVADVSCGVELCAALTTGGEPRFWGTSYALDEMPQG